MIRESQNQEWKETWRDEYLKWICGFANAQGGSLIIGKNDQGIITGLDKAKTLLEKIPNKVQQLLGIIVDVHLKSEHKKEYLEIKVEAYPNPVNYKGQYHYRSGSTKQELRGAALDKFLLQKQGKRWDGIPVPKVTVNDLDNESLNWFREQGSKSKRVHETILEENNEELLQNLHLTENIFLKRASLLLFHPDPEKYVTGAYIKVGYFKTDDDLAFQDEIHGSLFEQSEKTLNLLLTKYLKAHISYDGMTRKEEYPFPTPALRETLLNAIVHKDYSQGTPIQISVYDDKIIFWNEAQLPENWTVETLSQKHPSRPYNPNIANAFFRAGLIESWGRGTLKIIRECQKARLPKPKYSYEFSGFIVEIYARKTSAETPIQILRILKENPAISLGEVAHLIDKSLSAVERAVAKLVKLGNLKRIGPNRGGYWEVIDKD